MTDDEKTKLYIDFELRWNRRLGWILSRALMITGVVAVVLFFVFPAFGEKIIYALTGAVIFYLSVHLVLYLREKRLSRLSYVHKS